MSPLKARLEGLGYRFDRRTSPARMDDPTLSPFTYPDHWGWCAPGAHIWCSTGERTEASCVRDAALHALDQLAPASPPRGA